MLRRLLTRQIRAIQEGAIPEGTGPESQRVIVRAGNYFE